MEIEKIKKGLSKINQMKNKAIGTIGTTIEETITKDYYLIDFENVGRTGLDEIENLSWQDEVHIFYSKNANTVTFDTIEKLKKSKAKIVYHEAKTGNNALDFQLSSYLGYLIGKNLRDMNIYVVSKDRGFECLQSFWEDYEQIFFLKKISDKKYGETIVHDFIILRDKKEKGELTLFVSEALINKTEEEVIYQAIENSNSYKEFRKYLTKALKNNSRAEKIYKLIKPLLKNIANED